MHAPRRFAMVRGVRLDRWVGSVIDCVDTMRELWGCVAGDLPGAPHGGKLTDGPVHDFGKASFQRTGNEDVRGEGRRRVQEKAARKSSEAITAGPVGTLRNALPKGRPEAATVSA
jgi:hypothetical protein